MKCLSDNQIKLYLTQFGLSKEEKVNVENHLTKCKRCHDLKQKYMKQISSAIKESHKICETVQDNMVDFLYNDVKMVKDIDIREHINHCDICSYYCNKMKISFSFEEIQALDIPVPKRLKSTIKKKVFGMQQRMKRDEIKKKVNKGLSYFVKDVTSYFKLSLRPVELAFRGKKDIFLQEISHDGGDLVVDVHESDRSVRIYSMENLELDNQFSDSKGFVVFKEIENGQYKISIDGFKIDQIKKINI